MALLLPGAERALLLNVSVDLADGAPVSSYEQLARAVDSGAVDSLLLVDTLATPSEARDASAGFESFTLLAYLAARTSRVGLVATIPTAHTHPYNIARRLASLDHISNGRAGALIVAADTAAEAANFGQAPRLPDDRARALADEYITILKKLWDSWEDDARAANKETGLYIDLDKVKAIDHAGEYFKVAGPIDVPRPPQGHPVLFQSAGQDPGSRVSAGIDVLLARPAQAGSAVTSPPRGAASRTLATLPFDAARAEQVLEAIADAGIAHDADGFDLRVRAADIAVFIRHASPLLDAQGAGPRATAQRAAAAQSDDHATPTLRGLYGLARPAHPGTARKLAA
jgi:hypothetical protein